MLLHQLLFLQPITGVTILYCAYEACLKNWYTEQYSAELERKFRLDLMDELLFDNGWTLFDVEQNIDSEWIMVGRDPSGWMVPSRSLPYIEDPAFVKYRAINGAEINNKTGAIQFFLSLWTLERPVSEKLFTLFDLYQILARDLSIGIFSLDPVDPDKPYHPFNLMQFAPEQLYESEILNSMLLTDYILKFLTTSQEIQGQYPFDQRPIDTMISHLPEYLRKIITDFQSAQHIGMLHRFWIEAEEIDVAVEDRVQGDLTRIGVNRLRMVVKKHRMERDIHGKLKDVGNEDEGWPIYVLTLPQFTQLMNGHRKIEGHAMIFIYREQKLFYWENNDILQTHVAENYCESLIRLYLQVRGSTGKIIVSSKNESLIYRVVREMSRQSGMAHRYSSEFIFAHEFTLHYDEFVLYLPEFGRLKELCKIMTVVRILSGIYDANQKELVALKTLLNGSSSSSVQADAIVYKQYKESMDKVCNSINSAFFKLRAEVATSVLKRKWSLDLSRIVEQMGTLNFSLYSAEVKEVCDNYYRQLINANPHAPVWKLRQIVDEQRSDIATELSELNQSAVKKQLKQNFSSILSHVNAYQQEHFIHNLMNGNIYPLLDFLVVHERDQAIKNIIPQFPNGSRSDIAAAIDDGGESASSRVSRAEACQQLTEIKRTKEKVEAGFKQIHFKEQEHIKSPAGQCFWVPASVRHEVKIDNATGMSRYSFFVYGGVSLQPRINMTSGGGPLGGNSVNAGTFNRAQITQGYQSHHIVSQSNQLTRNHQLFQLAGMNINSAFNRIYLPPNPSMHDTRTIHSGRHTNSYSATIAKHMNGLVSQGQAAGWSQQQYRAETRTLLSELRQELRNGNIGLNKNHRPWATKW